MVLLILAVLAILVGMILFRAASRSPRTRTIGRRARRVGLWAFFAMVAVNAVLGAYAVLTPHFGVAAGKTLGTSLCITGAILMALCCEPAWERRLLTPAPVVGAVLGALAFAGLIAWLWVEPESATLEKLLASTFAAAIACTLASVVVLERSRNGISIGHERAITLTLAVIALDAMAAVAVIWIAPSSETVVGDSIATGSVVTGACILADLLTLFHPEPATRRVLILTLGLIPLAVAGAVALIWTTPSSSTVGNYAGTCGVAAVACALAAFLTHARLAPGHRWVLTAALGLLVTGSGLFVADIWADAWGLTRATGLALIAFAAFAVSLPVLHWLDRGALAAAAVAGGSISYCPHCGRTIRGELGVEARCVRCGRGFTVIDSEPRGTDQAVALRRLGAGYPSDTGRGTRERKTVSRHLRPR